MMVINQLANLTRKKLQSIADYNSVSSMDGK